MRNKSHVYLILLLALRHISIAVELNGYSKEDQLSGNFCFWTSAAASGRTHYSFLRRSGDTNSSSLRLYHSTWTDRQRLVDCAISDESAITERYFFLCRGERAANFSDFPDFRINTSLLFAPESPCAISSLTRAGTSGREKRDLETGEESWTKSQNYENSSGLKLRRTKRAWIFPGTLWCGSGNQAENYEDLGMFEQTDRCCRDHDHCKDTISAFKVNYGLFNRNFFTVSHCDCDRSFRQCLLGTNDTISNMVGYSFFNVLKIPCFLLTPKMQCTKMNWLGMCKQSEVAEFAVMRDATVYNSTHPAPEEEEPALTVFAETTPGSQSSTSAPRSVATSTQLVTASRSGAISRPPGRRPRPRPHCRPKDPPTRGDTFRSGKGRGAKRPSCASQLHANVTTAGPQHITPSTAQRKGSTALPNHWGNTGGLNNTLPTANLWTGPSLLNNHIPPIQNRRHRGKQQPCDCYKHLDDCKLKIPPHEERFGLLNLESKTLYHCNCTKRLARRFRQLQETDAIQSLLLDFVSLSCFNMPSPKECTRQKSCTAVLSKTPRVLQALRAKDAEEPNSKVKRQNLQSSRLKHIPQRLYRRCLRISSPKHGRTR